MPNMRSPKSPNPMQPKSAQLALVYSCREPLLVRPRFLSLCASGHRFNCKYAAGKPIARSKPRAGEITHWPDPTIVVVTLSCVVELAYVRVPSWRLNS